MKRLITLVFLALGFALSSVSVNAQPAQQQNIPQRPWASFPELERLNVPEPGQPTNRPNREARVLRKGLLAPSESDVNANLLLLSLKNTGLMRLLPREIYDSRTSKVEKRVNIRGGGTYFSFFYRAHEYNYGSDISYERGNLSVGFAGADYGFLTDLGDTPLEPIAAEDPRADFILNYQPPTKENEARVERRRFSEILTRQGFVGGVASDGMIYRRSLPAHVNHTYLLRSIVYDTSDVLVAFRVVSKNDDGGLTIAWKILKDFRPKSLERSDSK